MWSDHSMTGARLGWGITASSIPDQKNALREIERLAESGASVPMQKFSLEALYYSPDYGFLKMIMIREESGKDRRANKRIAIYQPAGEYEEFPEAYLAPQKIWPTDSGEEFLTPVTIGELSGVSLENFADSEFYDRLPEFLRALWWCVFEKIDGLNFVMGTGTGEHSAELSRDMMYLIHRILPVKMRRKAEYISYVQKKPEDIPFYFSEKGVSEHVIHLNGFREDLKSGHWKGDVLDEYFFYHLAKACATADPFYQQFSDDTEQYIDAQGFHPDTLRKLQWIFYAVSLKRGEDRIPKEELFDLLPELYYWSSREEIPVSYADDLRDALHQEDWTPEEETRYASRILKGYTKSSDEILLDEILWVFDSRMERDAAAHTDTSGAFYLMLNNRSTYVSREIQKTLRERLRQDTLPGEIRHRTEEILKLAEHAEKASDGNTGERNVKKKEKKSDTIETAQAESTIIETAEARKVPEMSLFRFLYMGFSVGFLTGCVLYVSHLSLQIGHWKIALGMGGMWVLIILNQCYMQLHQKEHYGLLRGIGVYLVEGYLIFFFADLIISQKIRLLYFVTLGVLAAIFEVVKILRFHVVRHKKHER